MWKGRRSGPRPARAAPSQADQAAASVSGPGSPKRRNSRAGAAGPPVVPDASDSVACPDRRRRTGPDTPPRRPTSGPCPRRRAASGRWRARPASPGADARPELAIGPGPFDGRLIHVSRPRRAGHFDRTQVERGGVAPEPTATTAPDRRRAHSRSSGPSARPALPSAGRPPRLETRGWSATGLRFLSASRCPRKRSVRWVRFAKNDWGSLPGRITGTKPGSPGVGLRDHPRDLSESPCQRTDGRRTPSPRSVEGLMDSIADLRHVFCHFSTKSIATRDHSCAGHDSLPIPRRIVGTRTRGTEEFTEGPPTNPSHRRVAWTQQDLKRRLDLQSPRKQGGVGLTGA